MNTHPTRQDAVNLIRHDNRANELQDAARAAHDAGVTIETAFLRVLMAYRGLSLAGNETKGLARLFAAYADADVDVTRIVDVEVVAVDELDASRFDLPRVTVPRDKVAPPAPSITEQVVEGVKAHARSTLEAKRANLTGHRRPYVEDDPDPVSAARRSAEIDRTEADGYDRDDPRRDAILASAAAWDRQADELERLARPEETSFGRRPEEQ